MKTKSTIKIGVLAVLAMTMVFVSPQVATAQSTEKVHEEVDELPVYPGGMEGLVSFMVDNLKYPKAAKKERSYWYGYRFFSCRKGWSCKSCRDSARYRWRLRRRSATHRQSNGKMAAR